MRGMTAAAEVSAGAQPAVFREFSTIQVGDTARLTRTIEERDVRAFADLSGDFNPLHIQQEFAKRTSYQRPVVHGMLIGSYVSTLVGMHLPGPGGLWTEQSFRWLAPVFVGDTLTVSVRVSHKSEGTRSVRLEVRAVRQDETLVMEGNGTAVLLEEQRKRPGVHLSERVVFVSGASRGIGAAIALEFGRSGAAVVVNYRFDSSRAEEVCQAINETGGRSIAVEADVTDKQAIEAAMCRAGDIFGKAVDVLVNNAAPPHSPRPFASLKWDDMAAQLDGQLKGAFLCTKAVVPSMLERKSGRIVNLGSALLSGTP
ncbi:MAG: SDR family NAD(P)-dependent oxidoreductase, partial [Acidobacteriaceae bacterium]|nr:SDR family NAD(P)-dependent oxidoreductase [Acidobacteriaceae bacterium]